VNNVKLNLNYNYGLKGHSQFKFHIQSAGKIKELKRFKMKDAYFQSLKSNWRNKLGIYEVGF